MDPCRTAIDVQDACNLTGVVHAFSQACSELRKLHPGEGTEFFNHHPVVIAFLSKLIDLSGYDDSKVSDAFTICERGA